MVQPTFFLWRLETLQNFIYIIFCAKVINHTPTKEQNDLYKFDYKCLWDQVLLEFLLYIFQNAQMGWMIDNIFGQMVN